MKPDPDRADRQEGIGGHIVEPAKVANVGPRPESLLARRELRAPRNRYKLVGVDTFDHWSADFCVGIFDNVDDAIAEAKARVRKYGSMNVYHLYDDHGRHVFSTR